MVGRPLSDLRGRTEEANELARWLRKVTAGIPVRGLEETFHYSKAMWTEYRNGSKLIPEMLLDQVVDELVPEDMRERVRANGRRLRDAAERLTAPQTTPPTPVVHQKQAPMPAAVAEVFLRLDDARLQQMEAMRKLAESEKRCTQLQDMVSFLQHQSIQLTEERDRALQEAREARDLQHALEQSETFRVQAEGQLQHARRAAQEAYDLRLAAEAKVAMVQTQVRRTTSVAPDSGDLLPQPAGGGMELPPMDRIAEVLRAAEEQLAEQDQELEELRAHIGVDENHQEEAAAHPTVIEGQVVGQRTGAPDDGGIVREAGQDNANNPLTSTDAGRSVERSPIVRALSRARSAGDLGAQIDAVRVRAGDPWTLTAMAEAANRATLPHERLPFHAIFDWIQGTRLPRRLWELTDLLDEMGVTQDESRAFRVAYGRVLARELAAFQEAPPGIIREGDESFEAASRRVAMQSVTDIEGLAAVLRGLQERAGLVGQEATLADAVFKSSELRHVMTVKRWLSGSELPTAPQLEKLMTSLKVSLAEWALLLQVWRRVMSTMSDEITQPRRQVAPVFGKPSRLEPAEDSAPGGTGHRGSGRKAVGPERRPFSWYAAICVVVGTVWAAFTAAVRADPGPAVWKLALFALVALGFSTLAWVQFVLSLRAPTRQMRVLAVRRLGVPVASAAGLTIPWLPSADIWGRWLADLVGLL
ncbi:hypothetical protein [Streptomyces sp. NPDC001930]|uniref:hypothetical protein n=1 Tax=Streptomyces sp. NPDC001930 TaxID=3364625 RepID=UPI0036C11C00